MPTREQLQQNIQALETQGASQQEIQAYLDTFKTKPSATVSVGGVEIAAEKKPFANRVAATLGLGGTVEALGKAISPAFTTPEGQKYLEKPTVGESVGAGLQIGSLLAPVGRVAKGVSAGVKALGVSAPIAKTIGAAGAGAGAGYAYDVGQSLVEGDGSAAPGAATAIGAITPPAIDVAIGGVNLAKKALPKLLSYSSDIPERALQTLAERKSVGEAVGTTAQEALKTTQSAVRSFRKTLSNEWDEGVNSIIDEFTGQRVGLSDNLIGNLDTVATEFGIDIPQNLKNISANEMIGLLKELNSLPRSVMTFSPKGALARKAADEIKDVAVGTFGGENGSFAQLYKNYSAKKKVFDSVDELVRAFETDNPKAQKTAEATLQKVFDENASAYYDAVVDFEKLTGADILSTIAGSKFTPILPKGSSISPFGKLTDKLIKLITFPISSPRSVSYLQRVFGTPVKPVNLKTPGDVIVDEVSRIQALPKAEKNAGFIKNPLIKAIDDPTKREMMDAIDYIRLGTYKTKPNQRMEEIIGLLAEKYGISSSRYGDVANAFEDLIENTKTIDRLPG